MAGLRIQKYPWSGLSNKTLRQLLMGKDAEAAAEKVWRGSFDKAEDPRRDEAGRRMLLATSHWLRGKKRLVKVSAKAQQILSKVALERRARGSSVARWGDIPDSESRHYGEGVMFDWEGHNTVTFAAPYGDFLAERVDYVSWARTEVPEGDPLASLYDAAWGMADIFPFVLQRSWYDEQMAQMINLLDSEAETPAFDMQRAEGLRWIHMTVNALAAMNTTYDIPIVRSGKGHRRRGRAVGGIRGVRPIELDESGLLVWSRKYIELPDTPKQSDIDDIYDGEGEGEGEPVGDRTSPCLHGVKEHLTTKWVLTPHPEEEIFDIREGDVRKDGTRPCYYAVKRKRKAHPRGKDLIPTVHRMKSGIDDIDTRS